MATKFPIQLNNLRFFVNPTQISVSKSVSFSTLATQGGVSYQVWYDAPEMLTLTGASAGSTAYRELLFLKRNFERTDKASELFYKTRLYRGFITSLTIEHSTSHINQFNYTIQFQLLQGEKFGIEDFSLTGKETGIIGTQLRAAENFVNEKLNVVETNISKLLSKL